jgi:hypothetical protein
MDTKRAVLVLFCFAFIVVLCGLFFYPDHTEAFVTVILILAGAIVMLAASQQIVEFSIGLGGIKAKLAQVESDLDDSRQLIKFFVTYSLAEVIYRELLWKIAHNIEVKCEHTPDQKRWLTMLFDQGLLQARDPTKEWKAFEEIQYGENLSDLFKATPAAEKLVQLRGPPK